MKNKNTFNVIANFLAYAFLVTAILLCFILTSCTATKSINQTKTTTKDSIVNTVSELKTNKAVTTTEIIYKGIKEDFQIKPDSSGIMPEFKRTFNNGNVKGEIGYTPDKGSYYTIETKDLKERNIEVITDTTKTDKITIQVKTIIDAVSDTILITKKWGSFQWITFIISLLVLIYIVFRIYRFITNPTGILKIFKKK